MAEVTLIDQFGKAIYRTLLKYRLRTVLEIGAFNGDGSTQVISKALSCKGAGVSLASLEYDVDRYNELVENTKGYPFVRSDVTSEI
jgi:hypothetical protein